jgi:hypothetical protein
MGESVDNSTTRIALSIMSTRDAVNRHLTVTGSRLPESDLGLSACLYWMIRRARQFVVTAAESYLRYSSSCAYHSADFSVLTSYTE